jgi:hypothetical protein
MRAALVAVALLVAAPASAQRVRAWSPPSTHDSLATWAAAARERFAGVSGDSVTGAAYGAYEQVGLIARRLLRGYGRDGLLQMAAVSSALDSLGLDTDFATEPTTPDFALLTVRHPAHPEGRAVGFLYWFRGADLRMQGVVLDGGHEPLIRVWWTGDQRRPYAWGVIERAGPPPGVPRLLLFHLTPEGTQWTFTHGERQAPVLGEPGEATWVDLDRDGRPEVVSWTETAADSLLELCTGCPRPVTERTFADRGPGFELLEARFLPSPIAVFGLFVRHLVENNRAAAARLTADPALVERAMTQGWNAPRTRGAWKVEYAEPGQAWPRWLAVTHRGRTSRQWIVHFTQKDGRWIVRDWLPLEAPKAPAPAASPPRR